MGRKRTYRAWDKKKQVMIYGIENAYDTLSGQCFDADGNDIKYDETKFADFLNKDRYEVMDFVDGLTDRGGRKIFEGDIIQYSYNDYIKRNAEVVFHKGMFCFLHEKELSGIFDFYKESYLIEIIGNIYENPSLLAPQRTEKGAGMSDSKPGELEYECASIEWSKRLAGE